MTIADLTPWMPLFVAILTIVVGWVGYSRNKSVDRRNTLIEMRRSVYRDFLMSLPEAVNPDSKDGLVNYQKRKVELSLIASDRVLMAAYAFTDLFSGGGGDQELRALRFAELQKAMRDDVYEATELGIDDLKKLAPFRL